MTGIMRIATVGQVVDSVLAVDGIEVKANNVTIKRSWVQGTNTGPGAGIWIDDGVTGTVIEDVEVSSHPGYDPNVESAIVDRAITAGSGKNSSGIRMTRVYAHDMIRGLQFSCGTIIEDSYVDGEVNPSDDHMSGVGGDTCATFSLTVRHNHIGLSPNIKDSGAMLMYPPQVGEYGTQNIDVSVTDNYIIGGTYCLYLSSDPKFIGTITVADNVFGKDYYSTCGLYGPYFVDQLFGQSPQGKTVVIWSDNIWSDGRVIPTPTGQTMN